MSRSGTPTFTKMFAALKRFEEVVKDDVAHVFQERMLDTTQDRDGDSSDVSKPVEDPSISSHTDEVPGGLRITDEVLVVSSHTDEVTSLPSDTFAVTQVASHSDEVPRNFEEDPKTVVTAKYSLADRMETLASTRTHNQGIQCTTELRREDGEDRTAWRTEGTIDAEVTEATVNDHVQQQHVPEQPADDQTTSSEAKDSSEGGTTPSDTAKRSGEESNAEELTKEEHENKRGANVSHKENHCNEEITDKTTTQGNSAARDQNHDVHD
ncbi:hypothetical protein JG687_00014085 [Phytophthora cactorum]|uniref:Uncharacterized protein n=1 Tax=Phytophthora cactorum TaxID=29920 RepID=A0A8T1U2J3_9STRA|nr:hypothetical protein JG687_00014085 [Phytophthora cactorum]